MTNIFLHPSVNTPEQVERLMAETGMELVQSNRYRNLIILITPEALLIRQALKLCEVEV